MQCLKNKVKEEKNSQQLNYIGDKKIEWGEFENSEIKIGDQFKENILWFRLIWRSEYAKER